jgi:hypothetical protein
MDLRLSRWTKRGGPVTTNPVAVVNRTYTVLSPPF